MAGLGQVVYKSGRIFANISKSRSYLSWPQYSRCLSCVSPSLHFSPSHTSHDQLDVRLQQVRCMSQKKNLFSQIIENIRQDMTKNKEMKESLQKFREEAEKLEQSDAIKKARSKYEAIEAETTKGSKAFKDTFSSIQEKLIETMEEVEKTELAQKSKKIAEEMSKKAEQMSESVSRQGQQISQSNIFKSVSEGVKSVKEEIDDAAFSRARIYKAPEKLRKRVETQYRPDEERPVEADTETTGVQLHKDSRWYQSWQNFKDGNQFVHKLFDMKTKYDESDHLFVRATRTFTDKMSDVFGSMFSKTEMSEVLTEIVKMDPNFDKENFIKECQFEIIPNVLEAMVRGDLDILQDWCHEAAFSTIAHPIKQVQSAGYIMESRVLDINHVDIAAGKMMEQGPVLVITFNAQQVIVVRDVKGTVMEGDPDKILKIFNVWAFCRDQTILDPKAAWRIIDLTSSPSEQWV